MLPTATSYSRTKSVQYYSDTVHTPADAERLAITTILGMTEEKMVLALNGNEETRESFLFDIRHTLVSGSTSDETGRAKLAVLKFVLAQSFAIKSVVFGSGSWSCRLVGLDLRGVDFSGIGLRGADFSNSDLTGANFSGAGLINAKFNDANLSYARFSDSLLWRGKFIGANLSHADFTDAELSGVVMRNANLHCARLKVKCMPGAKFDGANLSGADFGGGDFRMADFSGATIDSLYNGSAPRILPQAPSPQTSQQFAAARLAPQSAVKNSPRLGPETIRIDAGSPAKSLRVPMPQKSREAVAILSQNLPVTPKSFWSWISTITFRLGSFIRSIRGFR